MKQHRIAFLLAYGVASTAAQAAPSATDDYLAAGRQLVSLITKADNAARPTAPRLNDPDIASQLSILANTKVLTSRTYKLSDMETLMNVCGTANQANMSYALYGLKRKVDGSTDPQTANTTMRSLAERNIIIYQDELAGVQAFMVRCMAAQLRLAPEFLATLPPSQLTEVRKQGIAQMANGLMGMYAGALGSVKDARLKESYRSRLLEAMTETAPDVLKSLSTEKRAKLIELNTAVRQDAPKVFKSTLDRLDNILRSSRCITALCGYQ